MKDSLLCGVLKTLIFRKNIKTAQLARETNIPQQTLQRIVSGTSPNPHKKNLEPLATFFGISIEQLTGKETLPSELVENNLLPKKDILRKLAITPWEELDKHNPTKSHKQKVTENLDLNRKYIAIESTLPKNSFATLLNDSSMEPYFPKDSILILCPQSNLEDGTFVLVKLGKTHNIVFRQLVTDGKSRYLKPLNPDSTAFPIKLLDKDDVVLGKMIEFRYKFNHLN